MNSIEKLIKMFSEFPGIGPKQAKRFVYYLILKNQNYIETFKEEITNLKKEIQNCFDCKRYFLRNDASKTLCDICTDKSRDNKTIMIVSRDIDLENIEKSRFYNGKYFVLGDLIPILDKDPENKIRLKELLLIIDKKAETGLSEIILGLDANSEGEYTTEFVKKSISSISQKNNIKISELGRGLSTGTELEYSDPETIKNALKNRG